MRPAKLGPKTKPLRHVWPNYMTEVMFDWLTGDGCFENFDGGPKVWEEMLSRMMGSEDNWLYTFDQAYDNIINNTLTAWGKQQIDSGDSVEALTERLVTASLGQVDQLSLAIGLLKHSGHWHTYLRIMELPADRIEGDRDAAVLATARERRGLKAYLAEKEKEEQAEDAALSAT